MDIWVEREELAQQAGEIGLHEPVKPRHPQTTAWAGAMRLQFAVRGLDHLHQRRAAKLEQPSSIGQCHRTR